MTNQAIQRLANMECQLYGYGADLNANCPSYINGYMGRSFLNNAGMNYYNLANSGGYPNQDIFTQQNDATRVSNPVVEGALNNPQLDWSNPQYRTLSDDLNELGDYYVKHSSPSESFTGAAIGGAAFGLMNNMRLIAHPWNSFRWALKPTAEMFTDIGKEGSELRKLWINPETNKVVTEAYGQMHKLHGAMHSRLGLIKSRLTGDALDEAKKILEEMKTALTSGDKQKIAELSERARRLTNAKTGYIPQGWKAIHADAPFKWVKNKIMDTWIGKNLGIGAPKPTVAEVAAKNVAEKAASSTFWGSLRHAIGLNGALFAVFEVASDLLNGKIQDAFEVNNATGCTQLLQTATKGGFSAAGWMIGEGIGTWAGIWAATKIGAIAGSTVAPGVGTVIGAVAGLIGGSIGCWAMGKYVAHPLIGEEAGTLAKAQKLKRTAQGQVELLKLTAQQAEEDKKISSKTIQAINNVAQFYGNQQ